MVMVAVSPGAPLIECPVELTKIVDVDIAQLPPAPDFDVAELVHQPPDLTLCCCDSSRGGMGGDLGLLLTLLGYDQLGLGVGDVVAGAAPVKR